MAVERRDLGLAMKLPFERRLVEAGATAASMGTVHPPSISSSRRRGNPRWANPVALSGVPVVPSAWDRLLMKLALANDAAAVRAVQCGDSIGKEIVAWVRKNRGKFVPEAVLELLGMKEEVEGQHWWGGARR